MRTKLIKILIRLLSLEVKSTGDEELSKEGYDGLMSQLWQSPAFRKYLADRDKKLIWAMAGGEGLGPEPRQDYALHAGQRVENLLLGREAKAAFMRMQKVMQQSNDLALDTEAKT